MSRYRLRVEEAFCWGCKACEVACKQENQTPYGVKLIAVGEEFSHKADGSTDVMFRVDICRHCEEPPCAPACPVEAIVMRDDGIVILEHETCTGCEACLETCPYHAIAFDRENGVARKCNLCRQRVDSGLLPACADNVCLGHCIHFGTPQSLEKSPAGIRPEI